MNDLFALLRVYDRDGRVTVRSFMEERGFSSLSSSHQALHRLRARGLVTWTGGAQGTIRPRSHSTVWVRNTEHTCATIAAENRSASGARVTGPGGVANTAGGAHMAESTREGAMP